MFITYLGGVQGGNVGLGFETAKTLASWGADVTIACRNMKKADDCVKKIRKRLTELSDSSHRGSISAMELDLADLGKCPFQFNLSTYGLC